MTDNTTTQPTQRITQGELVLLAGAVAAAVYSYVHWRHWGLPPTILFALFGYFVLMRKDLLSGLFFVMALIMTVFALALNTPNHRARVGSCFNNMRMIHVAIEAYAEENGHYPPPYTIDENGNPLHSWRVLILPYMEGEALYDAIDLTKPWHHPSNLAFAHLMPGGYDCPEHYYETEGKSVTTAYVAVVGKNTAWPRTGRRKAEDIVDGTFNTLQVMESEKHRIHWMSTADPGIETLGPTGGQGDTLLPHSLHKDRFLCLFCDGHVQGLKPDYTTFNDFLSLLSIDGDEEHKLKRSRRR